MINATINARIRQAIRDAGARFVSIEAVAKTGEIKRFVFSDAARKTHLAAIVTASGAQAAETRALENPDLFNVWDIQARRWRCFDLNNVLTMKTDGQEYIFRHYRPQCFRGAA